MLNKAKKLATKEGIDQGVDRLLWLPQPFIINFTVDFAVLKKFNKPHKLFCELPYTAKLSRGKTFAVMHKTHYSLENFHGASGPCHYVLYTASDSRGKLSRLAKKLRKPQKFSPSKVLPYTVCNDHYND